MEENKTIELKYNELKIKHDCFISALERRNENVTAIAKIITSSFFILSFSLFGIMIIKALL